MSIGSGLAWLGFWIFAAVYVTCEARLFEEGYNTLFFEHRTPEEKALRKKAIYGEVKNDE